VTATPARMSTYGSDVLKSNVARGAPIRCGGCARFPSCRGR